MYNDEKKNQLIWTINFRMHIWAS